MSRLIFKISPFIFIGPAILLLFIFSIIPIVMSLIISFTDMDLVGLANWSKVSFIGFDNFGRLFNDPIFLKSIVNTLMYVGIGVPIVICLSLGIALLLNYSTSALFSGFRAIYYMPSITNIVAVAIIWGFLYNQEYGLFNYLLSLIDIEKVPWLEDPFVAKLSLILLAVWKGIGVDMIIFLAALQSIPKMYYEAADIDGANRWQKFKYVTLPSLSFAIFFVVVTKLIGWLQFFEEPFVMTGGGPLDGTVSMALFIYQEGFEYSRFGYASAASFVLFAVIIGITLVQFTLRKSDK
ncbi:sugar ABC transporter permease [Gracilibacillus oryzae]|uniref:Sugar ABC transporter permease n=1 Tax=Gracilibacillus oryzae TaxID=1672701 RepID=A0A7C8GQY8_9BACI|nr:sugar ABC transporter permease [Gracilibacillus oryzae]KAB8126545.1 sugar ABC transporter permease [Gracilibacillus oryzae]